MIFLLQVAKVCRAQAQIASNERNIEEGAQFLLLAEAPEGKAVEHPDKSGTEANPKSRQLNYESQLLRRFASICKSRNSG